MQNGGEMAGNKSEDLFIERSAPLRDTDQRRGLHALTGTMRLNLSGRGTFMGAKSVASAIADHVREGMDKHSVLYTNAGASTIGGVGTAALGFLFWGVAARFFPPHAVGVATAIISMMGLMGIIGDGGLGALLIGETLQHKGREGELILAAVLASLAASGVCGLAYFVLANEFGWQLGQFAHSYAGAVLFVGGCALSGAVSVLDQAFFGLLKSVYQMYRSLSFSLIKLLFLAALVTSDAMHNEFFIVLAWVVSILITILVFGRLMLKIIGPVGRWIPDFRLLGRRFPLLIRHHMLNLATLAPGLIIPVLVTILVSPEASAAFYPAWMIICLALFGSGSLATTLYAIGRAEPSQLPSRLLISLGLSAVVGAVTASVLFFFSGTILGLFNHSYRELAGPSLQLLGFGVIAAAIKQHYIAVSRLANRVGVASVYLALGALLEIGLAAAGSQVSGLFGVTVGWLLAVFLEASLMLKPIAKAMLGGTKTESRLRSPARIQSS